ncbi:MAG TPA: hypothetical protein PLL77_05395 [Pyrinomonadaceae bacterium]|nr:hypothetical protein [Pyrinomonadaceae bacterium]
MREIFVILVVILVLLGLTALRYRKQIAGILGLARALKEAKDAVGHSRVISSDEKTSIPLVNCSKCGVWVPQNKARKIGEIFYCSDECLSVASVSADA